MNLCPVRDLAYHRKPGHRLLGIDFGQKNIGIALSDITWCIATPLLLIRRINQNTDYMALQKVIDHHKVGGVVVGFPLNMNGSQGPQAEKMQKFACSLAGISQLPVALWDERLSTVAITRTLLAADMSRKRRAEVVDKLSATYILQSVLDHLKKIAMQGCPDP